MGRPDNLDISRPLLVGFGITSQAVARALLQRSIQPVVVDDKPTDASKAIADDLGIRFVGAPSDDELEVEVKRSSVLLPSPGVPDHHTSLSFASAHNVAVASEFDLAQMWDDRPLLTVTGTNGKTTVTLLACEALNNSGIAAEAVGNTDVPLVAAINNADTDVFVVEASSFRLGYSHRFSPTVSCWINFAPDHLDAHATLEDYRRAKASIWDDRATGNVAIGNADDEVVAADAPADTEMFSLSGNPNADWRCVDGELIGPDGPWMKVADLKRRQPHDVANALAVAAVATAGGASLEAIAETLASFSGFAHRLQLVGSWGGVEWYNDSKATVPHATLTAVGGFESVVLIAGGRNKGLDMSDLTQSVPPVHSVVATGEAAEEILRVFPASVAVKKAETMEAAVEMAAELSRKGDVVVLSPGCTSFDWYSSYTERGDDFCALVRKRHGVG